MDLSLLADFHLVASHGGLGKASRASGRPKASLSRRLSDFEQSLNVRLIERGPRNLELTNAGRELMARTLGPMREILEAAAAVREGAAIPRGTLRVAAPLLFSQVALGRLAAAFRARYPEIMLEVVSEDRRSELVEEHFDLAIRINPRPDTALVGRCFAKDKLVLVAAPFIRQPEGPSDRPLPIPAVVMPTHRDGDIWSLSDTPVHFEPQPVLRLSSLLTIRDAVTAGAGVAMLPHSIIGRQLEAGTLCAWGIVGNETELWVLHTSRRLQSPKVRAFVEFICTQYPSGSFEADQ
jgi:DNA-binding transcriptional LysR family regulator